MRKNFALAVAAMCLFATLFGRGTADAQTATYQWTLSAASTTAGVSPAIRSVVGYGSCAITIDGYASGDTFVVEGSSGGSTQPVLASGPSPAATSSSTLSASGIYFASVAGLNSLDVRLSALGSGTPTVSITCAQAGATSGASAQNSSGLVTPVQCDKIAFSTSSSGVIITHSGTTTTYVCSVVFGIVGSSGAGVYGKYGSGTVCGTASQNLFETYTGTQATYAWGSGIGALFTVPSGNDFCFGTVGTITNSTVTVTYAQF